jgi:hypothetical protein
MKKFTAHTRSETVRMIALSTGGGPQGASGSRGGFGRGRGGDRGRGRGPGRRGGRRRASP